MKGSVPVDGVPVECIRFVGTGGYFFAGDGMLIGFQAHFPYGNLRIHGGGF